MSMKEIFTAAILGIVFGILFGIGFDHATDDLIDTKAIQEALNV